MKPIQRSTPNCRIFVENDGQRNYATEIERKLRALGVTVDFTIWKDTLRKSKMPLEKHLGLLQK